MSKRTKRPSGTATRQTTWCEVDPPRPAVDINADAVRAVVNQAGELPGELRVLIADAANGMFDGALTVWDDFQGRTNAREAFYDLEARAENDFIAGLIQEAVELGFRRAIERYADQLRGVPELAAWQRQRTAGGDRGRATLSQKAKQRAKLIRDTWATMEAAGQKPTNQSVAAAVGCGVSTVIRAFKSKPAKRTKR